MDDYWDLLGAELDARYGAGKWHCDDIWAEQRQGCPVRAFLDVARAPAYEREGEPPALFATYEGKRVRVVMASRFGDVGITENLSATHGYKTRVYLPDLTDFSGQP